MLEDNEVKGYFSCPICGQKIEDANAYSCPNCTYNFGQLIDCVYKMENKCSLSSTLCKIHGLNYQECDKYNMMFYEGILPGEGYVVNAP